MAYQVLATNLLQSAIKAAAQVTSASITVGDEDAKADPIGFLNAVADDLFGKLKEQADKDNKQLREEAEKNPPRRGDGGWKDKPGGGKGFKDAPADGSMVLSWGSFKGKSIAEVYELDEEAAAEYGYETGSGAKYVNWLSGNDKNKYAADHAKAFLDAKKDA